VRSDLSFPPPFSPPCLERRLGPQIFLNGPSLFSPLVGAGEDRILREAIGAGGHVGLSFPPPPLFSRRTEVDGVAVGSWLLFFLRIAGERSEHKRPPLFFFSLQHDLRIVVVPAPLRRSLPFFPLSYWSNTIVEGLMVGLTARPAPPFPPAMKSIEIGDEDALSSLSSPSPGAQAHGKGVRR